MYSIINIKDRSKDRSRAFACTKSPIHHDNVQFYRLCAWRGRNTRMFCKIATWATSRVRRREAPALRHQPHRQVERLAGEEIWRYWGREVEEEEEEEQPRVEVPHLGVSTGGWPRPYCGTGSTARPWAFPARQEEPQFGSLQDLDQRDAGNYITLVLREPRLTEISPLGPWPRRRSRAEAVRSSRRHSAQAPVLARFHDPVKRNKRSGIANIRSITSNYIGNCS